MTEVGDGIILYPDKPLHGDVLIPERPKRQEPHIIHGTPKVEIIDGEPVIISYAERMAQQALKYSSNEENE